VGAFAWIDDTATPDSLIVGLARVPVDASIDEQTAAADRFLSGLGGLGVASAGASPQGDFVVVVARGLAPVWVGVLGFVSQTRHLLRDTFYGEEWRIACERRTALQFMAEWFVGGPLAERLGELELDSVDELLRERGRTEGLLAADQIPEGIPRSHWWWWWPEY
jgi:hypothetical protein